jgi:hypothetical protein
MFFHHLFIQGDASVEAIGIKFFESRIFIENKDSQRVFARGLLKHAPDYPQNPVKVFGWWKYDGSICLSVLSLACELKN